MRLCIIGNPNSIHVQRWIRYFLSRAYEIHLIGEHPLQKQLPGEVFFYDLTAIQNIRKLRYLSWGLAVRKIVRQIQPNILQAISVTSAGWLGAASGWHPLVVTAIGSDLMLLNQRSWLHRQLSRWSLGRADFITCVSKTLSAKAQAFGAPASKTETMFTGIDLQAFYPPQSKQSAKASLGLGQEPVIISIRAMNAIYHPVTIAQSIPSILDQFPSVRFLIFTYNKDPQTFEAFEAIVDSHKSTASVKYIPELPDDQAIAGYYRAADIAISVPSSDGTPASVLECMACGTALVVSDLPSLHEWINHGQEGLFVPVGEPQAVVEAVIRLLSDADFRQKIGNKASTLILQTADRNELMHKYEELYNRLAGK